MLDQLHYNDLGSLYPALSPGEAQNGQTFHLKELKAKKELELGSRAEENGKDRGHSPADQSQQYYAPMTEGGSVDSSEQNHGQVQKSNEKSPTALVKSHDEGSTGGDPSVQVYYCPDFTDFAMTTHYVWPMHSGGKKKVLRTVPYGG